MQKFSKSLEITILCSKKANIYLPLSLNLRQEEDVTFGNKKRIVQGIWFGCKNGFVFSCDKLFRLSYKFSLNKHHLDLILQSKGILSPDKGYEGDINCICETSNPNYILAGVDNFAIYLLKVGKDS